MIKCLCEYVSCMCISCQTSGSPSGLYKYGPKPIPTYHRIPSFDKKHKPDQREKMASERASCEIVSTSS